MTGFIDLVRTRARADRETIVPSESMDRGTWEATEMILKEDVANLIIIGTPENIADHSKGPDVSGATVINPQTYGKTQEYIDLLVELGESKGITPEKTKEVIMSDCAYYGCLMIRNGSTDGLTSGAYHSTTDTLRPCLQIVKTEPGMKLVSAFSLVIVPDCEYGADGASTFTDSGLNQNPNPEELATIAKSSADSLELLVQKETRVAILFHSTKSSAKHPDADKVVKATRIAEEPYPELKLDGEPQLGAAFVPEVASSKTPDNEVADKTNALIFPDLDAGNIGYKLAQRLAKAEVYGLVTRGTVKSVNDLSRGCCANGIVGVVTTTTAQAQIE